MAKKEKVRIDFSRMKDDELLVRAQTVLQSMTDNAHYPAPVPALEEITTLAGDYTAKLSAARKRGAPEDTALKNESRAVLEEALQRLGYYVNTEGRGLLSVLLSSGFEVSAPDTPSLIPLPVEGVRLVDGRQSGQVRLDFTPLKGALFYEYHFRPQQQPEAEWSDRLTTTSSRLNIIAPLEAGVRYEVQVRAGNVKGTGDWSQTVTILVR